MQLRAKAVCKLLMQLAAVCCDFSMHATRQHQRLFSMGAHQSAMAMCVCVQSARGPHHQNGVVPCHRVQQVDGRRVSWVVGVPKSSHDHLRGRPDVPSHHVSSACGICTLGSCAFTHWPAGRCCTCRTAASEAGADHACAILVVVAGPASVAQRWGDGDGHQLARG